MQVVCFYFYKTASHYNVFVSVLLIYNVKLKLNKATKDIIVKLNVLHKNFNVITNIVSRYSITIYDIHII